MTPSPPIPSGWLAWCPRCPNRILPGQPIRNVGLVWVHDQCCEEEGSDVHG